MKKIRTYKQWKREKDKREKLKKIAKEIIFFVLMLAIILAGFALGGSTYPY